MKFVLQEKDEGEGERERRLEEEWGPAEDRRLPPDWIIEYSCYLFHSQKSRISVLFVLLRLNSSFETFIN